MKKIYVCSPYAGDTETNVRNARKYCEYVVRKCGAIPIAPHLFFPQFLDDDDPDRRELGQLLGMLWLEECDELWVIGRHISDGMKKEIEMAKKLDIPVRYFVAKRTREERFLDALMFPDIAFREMD